MFRTVEFERIAKGGKVYIVPDHVVKVEPLNENEDDERPYDSLIATVNGIEMVVGPPSEVNQKLQRGM